MRPHLPFGRSRGVLLQEAQRQGERVGIGARQRGAAEHHVDPVGQNVGPDPLPEQFDGPLAAIFLDDAGAPEFQEALALVAGEHRRDVEFLGRVEAAGERRHLLAHQPVGADDATVERAAAAMVDDQEMVAIAVEAVAVAPGHALQLRGLGAHLLVEDAVAQFLRRLHLGRVAGEPHLQIADSPERGGSGIEAADDVAHLGRHEAQDHAAEIDRPTASCGPHPCALCRPRSCRPPSAHSPAPET